MTTPNISNLTPVRILIFRRSLSPSIRTAFPYEFRSIVQGHFGHKHISPDYIMGFREPASVASADMQSPVVYQSPVAPFFICRSGIGGGFASLSDSDISFWLMRAPRAWERG